MDRINPNNVIKAGDIIPFGKYIWRVLHVNDDNALIITENIVELRGYHTNHHINTTWEQCELRQYLNSKFYSMFNDSERTHIMQTSVKNADNEVYGTNGGNDTVDKIFLLSLDEAERYFKDDADRIADYDNEASYWWLRSPGRVKNIAIRVNRKGAIYPLGNFTNYHSVGVRPALLMKL